MSVALEVPTTHHALGRARGGTQLFMGYPSPPKPQIYTRGGLGTRGCRLTEWLFTREKDSGRNPLKSLCRACQSHALQVSSGIGPDAV